MTLTRHHHEDNRRSWNSATRAHNSHKGDQAAFLRGGGGTLFPEETDLLGDISGRTLLHLQCNSGQDTLSLAARGALATGVDISDEAVAFATRLSAESGIPADFVRSDVFDYFDRALAEGARFDRVFCSYGSIVWLSDLTVWATGIAGVLAPGGRFVIVDFHPVATMFDHEWTLTWDYWAPSPGSRQTFEDGVGDYVKAAREALVPWGYEEGMAEVPDRHRCHQFAWGLSDVVGSLLGAGLEIEALREYPWFNGAVPGPGMRELPGRRFLPPAHLPAFPLMFGVAAARRD